MLLAGAIVFVFVVVLDVVVVVVVLVVVFTGGATLTGATLTGATFAGLAGALFAGASPQAIPSALNPRTVESTITFFIFIIKLLSFLKELITY